jgi:hypothetical protein
MSSDAAALITAAQQAQLLSVATSTATLDARAARLIAGLSIGTSDATAVIGILQTLFDLTCDLDVVSEWTAQIVTAAAWDAEIDVVSEWTADIDVVADLTALTDVQQELTAAISTRGD